MVGYNLRPDNVFRGFLWQNGVTTPLGTLGRQQSWASDINDNGHVVGAAENANERVRAFRWVNGTMRFWRR